MKIDIIILENKNESICSYCGKKNTSPHKVRINTLDCAHLSCFYNKVKKFLKKHQGQNTFSILKSNLRAINKYKKEMILESLE